MTRRSAPGLHSHAARGNEKITSSEFLLYTTQDGRQRIEVRLENETVWMSQLDIAELYQTSKQNISLHLNNIYKDGELERSGTVKDYLTVRQEGKRRVERKVEHYRLEAIIAVGYRVRSHRGTQFRQWATEQLQSFVVKGFVLDDERLAEPGGMDYFDELLERIRAIRASEKRFYQKVRDIYTLSIDYDGTSPMAKEFFATVQNKMLYAATGMTAAEIIQARADAAQPNMGLTTWKGAGRGRVLTKTDVNIAKNYMKRDELTVLELLVGQFLDFAEMQAMQRKAMTMGDWIAKLDGFLKLNDQQLLTHAGRVTAAAAKSSAHDAYQAFAAARRKGEADEADQELLDSVKQLSDGHDKA
jgi:hypothetical protein